jgi:hypothetical protein
MANRTVFVAVAGDPVTVAVTTRSVNGVIVVGRPERIPFESRDKPVPLRAGADKTTGFLEAATAENCTLDV